MEYCPEIQKIVAHFLKNLSCISTFIFFYLQAGQSHFAISLYAGTDSTQLTYASIGNTVCLLLTASRFQVILKVWDDFALVYFVILSV